LLSVIMKMSSAARSRHHGHRHHGKWILLDADLQHLWTIGTDQYPAQSARVALDYVARRGLVPALRAAVETRRPVDRTVHVQRASWRIRAIPLLGIVSHAPIAVLGIYDAPTADIPPPPVVGTWEMHVTPPGPGQELHSNVSPAMYEAYGAPVDDVRIDTSRWGDDLVALADRPRARAFFTTLFTDPEPELRFFDFTAAPPNTHHRYALRRTGRRYEQDGQVWARGLTFRRFNDPIPDQPRHLEAVLTLSRDPVWMIDPVYGVVSITTDNLAAYDLKKVPTRALADMCHPEDLPVLLEQIRWASENLGQRTDPVRVRLATTNGDWRTLEICSVGVRIADGFAGVWCRVSTASPR
jgi:hypothetical protein